MKLFDFQRETLALIAITSALFVLSGGDFITDPKQKEMRTAMARTFVWCEQWNQYCSVPFNTTYLCWRFEAIFADPSTEELYQETLDLGWDVCEALASDMLTIKEAYNFGAWCQLNPVVVKLVAAFQMCVPLLIFLPNIGKNLTLHRKFTLFILAHSFNALINVGFGAYLMSYIGCFSLDSSFVIYLVFFAFSLINIGLLIKLKKISRDAELKSSFDQNLALAPIPPKQTA